MKRWLGDQHAAAGRLVLGMASAQRRHGACHWQGGSPAAIVHTPGTEFQNCSCTAFSSGRLRSRAAKDRLRSSWLLSPRACSSSRGTPWDTMASRVLPACRGGEGRVGRKMAPLSSGACKGWGGLVGIEERACCACRGTGKQRGSSAHRRELSPKRQAHRVAQPRLDVRDRVLGVVPGKGGAQAGLV